MATIKSYRFAAQACLMAVLALQLCGCGPARMPTPSPPGYKMVVFPNGDVQFDIPEKYELIYEQDESISVYPSEGSGIVLRFTLQNLPEPIAKDFLEMQAKEKGLKVVPMGDKATISELASHREEGHDYEMTFWQIGFENMLVVMSAEVDQTRKQDPIVVECLKGVPAMIESMHKF